MTAPTPPTGASPDSSPDPKLDLANATRTEFINAVVHLYRGELGEATAWRTRIDATSNWAVVVCATSLSFVFADNNSERHVLIPIISVFITFMLFMEARRYRFYDIWRTRARLLEINFYRPMLDGSPPDDPDWNVLLAQDMRWPHFHMPWWEAAGRRLRRNYQWLYAVLLASWLIVLFSQPNATTELDEVVRRAAVGPVPGGVVIAAMFLFYGALFGLGVYSLWASRYRKSTPAGHPARLRESRKRPAH